MDNMHPNTTGNSGVERQAATSKQLQLLREIGRILAEEEEAMQQAEAVQSTSVELPGGKPHPGGGLLREVGGILSEDEEAKQDSSAACALGTSRPGDGKPNATISSEFSGQEETRVRVPKIGCQPLAEEPEFLRARTAGTNRKFISEAFTTLHARITAIDADRNPPSPATEQPDAPSPSVEVHKQSTLSLTVIAFGLILATLLAGGVLLASHPAEYQSIRNTVIDFLQKEAASNQVPGIAARTQATVGAAPQVSERQEFAKPSSVASSRANVGPDLGLSTAETSTNPSPARTALDAIPSPPRASSTAIAPTAAATGSQMILHARDNCWVEVRERSGRVLLNRVLRRNETWPVPAGLDLLLTTRNAGAIELIVNGRTTPRLGPMHAVRRDIPLASDLIKTGGAVVR